MFGKQNKNIRTFQESLKGFVTEIESTTKDEFMQKQKDFNTAIIMSKEVCEELKKILPPGQHLLAVKLQHAIGAAIISGEKLYKQGFVDCIEYVNYAIENEHYKTVK